LRKLRIAAPSQLTLGIPELDLTPPERWWSLPQTAQEAVVAILARMITAGVVEEDEEEVTSNDTHH
jgi:hypothetical protein